MARLRRCPRPGRSALIIAALLVAVLPAVLAPAPVAAAGSLEDELEARGFDVSVDDEPFTAEALAVDGIAMTVTGEAGSAHTIHIIYSDHQALAADWEAVSGQSPQPHTPTGAFDGYTLYWNNNLVLALESGIDAALTGEISDAFFSLDPAAVADARGASDAPGDEASGADDGDGTGEDTTLFLVIAGTLVLLGAGLLVAALVIRRTASSPGGRP